MNSKIKKSISDGTTTCDLCGGVIAEGDEVHEYSDNNSLCDDCSNVNIASSWKLWCEYVDTGAIGTEEEFEAMPLDDRLALMADCGM